MKFNEAVTALKFNREKNFVLTGPENFLKEHFIKLAREFKKDYEFVVFSPDNQKEALELIGTAQLFTHHLVVLHDFNKMNVSKFEETFKNFDGCIIFVLPEKADVKSRAMSKIMSYVTQVECNKMRTYGEDYPMWIMSRISEAGYKAQGGVDSLIYTKVGPSLFTLSNELDKLFAVKKDGAITLYDVEKYVSKSTVGTSFELLDLLLKQNVGGALSCFESFAGSQDNFIEISAFMGSYLEKMYRILLLQEEKMPTKDISEIIGIHEYILKTKYLSRINILGKNFIASKIDLLCNMDVQLRLFKGDKRIIFEKFIQSFAK
jgi:DNA polymerase III delta subunit